MTWLIRAILGLAPRDFRDRYGDELLEVHAARAAGAGGLGFQVREVLGAAAMVLALHRERWREAATGTATTGGAGMLETTAQDLRFAARSLLRNPGYAAAAVAVLALGIGATTAIFSAANAYLFRPLPFAEPERLVRLYETNPEFEWDYANAAPANALDWRDEVAAFDDVALYSDFDNRVAYVHDGEPELLDVINVSGNFFSVLGVPAVAGRMFTWDETWEGNDAVVVLSHAFWRSHFGGDPSVVGTTLALGNTTVEIVGVAPPGFSFPHPDVDVWTPWGWAPGNRTEVWFRRAHWVSPVARLAPGVTPAQANAALQVVVKRLQEAYPETNRVMGAGLLPLRDFMVRDVRGVLYVFFGAVSLLLLLACINVANLNLVRASGRTREVAVRHALGAGRRRLMRLLLTEGLVVAVLGGLVGLALGWVAIRVLSAGRPLGIPGATGLVLDGRVVLFTLAVTLVAGLLSGAVPAVRGTGRDLQSALKDGGRAGSGSRSSRRTASLLVAAEVALAVLLVVGAGLLGRSYLLLRSVDPGFRVGDVSAVRFTIPSTRYQQRDEVLAFQDEYERRLEARPGIRRVGMVAQLPLTGTSWSSQFQAEGWPTGRVGFEIIHRRADTGFFEAVGTPLLRGRLFEASDAPDAPLVVVINETFARQHFPGEDPVGQRIAYDRAPTPASVWYEIVGIVGDQAQEGPGTPPRAEVFESRRQDWDRGNWVVFETEDGVDGVAAARAVLEEMDRLIPMADARTLRQVWRTSMARDTFILQLMGTFGVLALILATVGVYGVTAQAARRRNREIGIRMALGAGGGDVVGMVLRQGMGAVIAGLAAGIAVALVASRALTALLYGVAPTDAPTLIAVVAILGGVAAAACYLPARRATTVDPVRSLRSE